MAESGFLDTFEALGAALGGSGETVLRLRLDLIDEDPDNPRQAFDEAELEALTQTVKASGVLQPVIVRPPDSGGRYRLRFGARRFRAALRAALVDIPAIIRGIDTDPAEMLVEQLIENDQREGLSTSELAKAVDRLLELGLNQADIARRLGRPKPQIAMLAAVKSMAPELRALAPRLGSRTLYELHAAWKTDAARTLKFLKDRRPETITQAEARDLAGRPPPRRVRDPADGSVREIEALPSSVPKLSPSESGGPRGVAPAFSPTAEFEVVAPGLRGTLVLANVSAPSQDLLIRTADGALQTAPAAKVKIVRVKPG